MQSEGGAKLEAFHRCFSARIYRRLKAASRLVAIDGSAQLIEFARDKVAQFIGAKSQCRHSGTRSAQGNLKYAIKVPGRFCANSYQFRRGQSVSRTYDRKVAAIDSGGDPIDAARHSDSPAVRL